jgi:hypothetical protein
MTQGRNNVWLEAIFGTVLRWVRPFGRYPGRVVSQHANGTLEIQPDSALVGAHDFVPLRVGLPGVTVKVPSGARVVLAFAEGDPRKPYAELVETAQAIEIAIAAENIILNGGAASVARVGDRTSGHVHDVTFALTSPNGPVTGTIVIVSATDAIAEGAPAVKA